MRAQVHEGIPGLRSETTGVGLGFVKQVGFKPEVKERELWMSRVVGPKTEQEEVIGDGIGN